MTEPSFCPNCGAPQIPGAAFCVKCGQKLAGSAAPQAASPAQTQAPTSPPVAPPAWSQPGPPSGSVPPGAAPVVPPGAAPAVPPAWSQPVPPAGAFPPGSPVPPYPQPPTTAAGQQTWYRPPAPYPPGTGRPAGYVPPPGYVEPATPRPTGISILAVLEIVGGCLGLLAAKALFDYADAANYYLGEGSGGNYQFVGLLSAAGAIAAFVLAYGLWQIKAWAWPLGCGLCAVTVGFAVLSVINHGDAGAALINIGVSAVALYYLNTNDIRAIFGRPPSTFLQPR